MGPISNAIDGADATNEELWALAEVAGFEQDSSVLQLYPDPDLRYYAAVYSALGLEGISVGVFDIHARDARHHLSLKVMSEVEGPVLATCPLSLLDSTPSPDPGPGSLATKWRGRCREFHLKHRIAGGDPDGIRLLNTLQQNGRVIFSRIGN
jgi:hypothetical protein